jgi:hypothetical protein
MALLDWLGRLKRFDEARPNVPGEHLFAMSTGLWLLKRPSRSPAVRLVTLALGAAFVIRGLTGRQGPINKVLPVVRMLR